jgi:hypothetical protein
MLYKASGFVLMLMPELETSIQVMNNTAQYDIAYCIRITGRKGYPRSRPMYVADGI